jgi:hypothetical protein
MHKQIVLVDPFRIKCSDSQEMGETECYFRLKSLIQTFETLSSLYWGFLGYPLSN